MLTNGFETLHVSNCFDIVPSGEVKEKKGKASRNENVIVGRNNNCDCSEDSK